MVVAAVGLASPLAAQQTAEPEPEEGFLSRWWHEERTERWTITRDLVAKRELVDDLGGSTSSSV